MDLDSASLTNLRDIVEPPPAPWWPPAPGWWFLATALLLIAVLTAVRQRRLWNANAYRRAALRELRGAENLASIAEILKRVALAAHPRSQVASLTGSAWVKWLAETGGRPVPAAVSQALMVDVFADHGSADTSQLAAFAAEWIGSHKTGGAASPVREMVVRRTERRSVPKQGGNPC